ncbi:hypothetical protein D9M73_159470 [compost metagenome]
MAMRASALVPLRLTRVANSVRNRAMMMLVLLLGSKPIMAARYGPAPTATAAMVTHRAME